MSNSRRRSNIRRKGREKCPACGSKSVRVVNKKVDEFILECKRPSCNIKWHIPLINPNMKVRLSNKAVNFIKDKMPKEDAMVIKDLETAMAVKETESLLEIGPDGSYRLKK